MSDPTGEIGTLVQQLVKIRKDRGLSQKAVGALMGVCRQTVSGIEHSRYDVTLSTLQRYARAVGAEIQIEIQPEEAREYVLPDGWENDDAP